MRRCEHFSCLVVLPLLLAGCSEAVPPAAEGAFFAALQPGAHTGECQLDSAEPTEVGKVTATTHDELKKDTIDGALIYCSSLAQGGGFSLEGSIQLGSDHLEFRVPQINTDANSADTGADGSIGYAGTSTSGILFSSPAAEPCKFYFANDGQRSQLADGKMWVTFECATVENVSKQRACAVQIGYAAFQNCEQ